MRLLESIKVSSNVTAALRNSLECTPHFMNGDSLWMTHLHRKTCILGMGILKHFEKASSVLKSTMPCQQLIPVINMDKAIMPQFQDHTCPASWYWPVPASLRSEGAVCHHHRMDPSQVHAPSHFQCPTATHQADTVKGKYMLTVKKKSYFGTTTLMHCRYLQYTTQTLILTCL